MKKLILYFSLCILLLAAGWASARYALSGMEPYLAAAAGIMASAVSLTAYMFLHGKLKLAPLIVLTGGVLYLLFWKLTDTDLIGTCALLVVYAACMGIVFLSKLEPSK